MDGRTEKRQAGRQAGRNTRKDENVYAGGKEYKEGGDCVREREREV
jgi:hypothetical protein